MEKRQQDKMNSCTTDINHFILDLYNLKKRMNSDDLNENDKEKIKLIMYFISIYKDEKKHGTFKNFVEHVGYIQSPMIPNTNRTESNDDGYNSDFEFDEFGKDGFNKFIDGSFQILNTKKNFYEFGIEREFLMNYTE